MKKLLNILTITLFAFSAYGQDISNQAMKKGTVFIDVNRNGIRDIGEIGIKGVPVSNGQDVVLTNHEGIFYIQIKSNMPLFPILPADYDLSGKKSGVRNFTSSSIAFANSSKIEIGLVKRKVTKDFSVSVVGDMQVGDRTEIGYACNTILSELMSRNDLSFNIFLGDIVNDKPSLMPQVKDLLNLIKTDSWIIAGNHDRDNTPNSDSLLTTFNNNFGVESYSFNQGMTHFIMINNVHSTGGRSYEGYINDKQLKFIKNDLKYVPIDRLIVISQHIPIVNTKNRDSLLNLLLGRRSVLFLSGHTHEVSRNIFNYKSLVVHELVAGAACGNWWQGEKDIEGIPSAIMQCGSPRNYFVLNISGSKYTVNFKGVGLDEGRQMSVWVNGADSLERNISQLKLTGNEIIANIYGASDSTIVKIQVDGKDWVNMQRIDIVSPEISRLIKWNKSGVYPTKYSTKSALRSRNSPHVWIGYYDLQGRVKPRKIIIRASDPFGFSIESSTILF